VEEAVLNSFLFNDLTVALLGVSPERCVFCACNWNIKKLSFSFDDDDDDDDDDDGGGGGGGDDDDDDLLYLHFTTAIVSS
jgi:hypothetical protein